MAQLLIASRSMALALRLADVHAIEEHSPDELDTLTPGPGIDCIVLDVGEARLAVDTVARLREQGHQTPVVLVSGYQHEWSGVAALGLPKVEVVGLPITQAALLEGIGVVTGHIVDLAEVQDGPAGAGGGTEDGGAEDGGHAAGDAEHTGPVSIPRTSLGTPRSAWETTQPGPREWSPPSEWGPAPHAPASTAALGASLPPTGGIPRPEVRAGRPAAGPPTGTVRRPVTGPVQPAPPASGPVYTPPVTGETGELGQQVQGKDGGRWPRLGGRRHRGRPATPQPGRPVPPQHPGSGAIGVRRPGIGPSRPQSAPSPDQPVAGAPSFSLPPGLAAHEIEEALPGFASGPLSDSLPVVDAPGEAGVPVLPELPGPPAGVLAPPAPAPGDTFEHLVEPDDTGMSSALERRLDQDAGSVSSSRTTSTGTVHIVPRTADLVRLVIEAGDQLYGVADTAQVLADDVVERADADAAAVLVPDDGRWRVSGGVGLRPLERRLQLSESHWLVREIANTGRAVLIEDTDIIRQQLAGAPLAAWRHLLAVPVPDVRAAVLLARGSEAGAFTDADLAAVVPTVREAAGLLAQAIETRQLARLLGPLRELDGDSGRRP